MGKNKKKHLLIIGCIFLVMALINVFAWLGPNLAKATGWNWCNGYADYVFPLWTNSVGRIMDVFPFSVGEIMLVLAVIIILFSVIYGIAMIFLRKKAWAVKFAGKYYTVLGYIVAITCLVMTLNCMVLYHVDSMDGNELKEKRTYSVAELQTLRNFVVEKCNGYYDLFARDDKGRIVYEEDLQKIAKESMQSLAVQYPRLKGFYPDVKHMMFSNLMSQMYMCGYYFPFSMEANCNGNMYITNYPSTYCHELAHLHGYIYEDEANFIAFLACINSEDKLFQYCGWLSVLYYIDNEYWDCINQDASVYWEQPVIKQGVDEDCIFLVKEKWEEVEESAIIDTEIVSDASENFTETTLNLNGVTDGMASYSRVTDLILQYYDGDLY